MGKILYQDPEASSLRYIVCRKPKLDTIELEFRYGLSKDPVKLQVTDPDGWPLMLETAGENVPEDLYQLAAKLTPAPEGWRKLMYHINFNEPFNIFVNSSSEEIKVWLSGNKIISIVPMPHNLISTV